MACGCDGVKVGEFRSEIIIKIVIPINSAPDASGGRSRTWTTYKTIRVKAEYKSGGERWARQDQNTEQKIVFTGWYDSTIFPDLGAQRIEFNGQVFNMTFAENIEDKNIYMRLTGTLQRMKTT